MTERLTETYPCNKCKVEFCSRLCYRMTRWAEIAKEKLSEYETAEEEGRLVVLPSNQVWESQGDIVYYIYDYEITECVNCGISICADGKAWIGLAADEDIFPYREPIAEFDTDPTDWCKKTTDVLALEWGKTVFLTREEAEKALKEMEKDDAAD